MVGDGPGRERIAPRPSEFILHCGVYKVLFEIAVNCPISIEKQRAQATERARQFPARNVSFRIVCVLYSDTLLYVLFNIVCVLYSRLPGLRNRRIEIETLIFAPISQW